MRRDRLPLLVLPVAALLVILPLILQGCSCGHDFDFHLLSWIEAADQFRHGTLHPHWAFSPAWNAGEPRFVFYPPLSWTLGALLGLPAALAPGHAAAIWTAAPIAFTWIAAALAGLTFYRLARTFVSPPPALLAATLYLVNPYLLFTAYERTAYGELLAYAWIPLLFHAILRPRVTIPGTALPVALLWLTNAPAAVMSSYALALLTVIRLAAPQPPAPGYHPQSQPQSRAKLALNTLAGTALGLALAAFFLLPAALERGFVQVDMAFLPGLSIADNFLFHHTPDPAHDLVLHTASLIALGLLTLTLAGIALAGMPERNRNPPASSARDSQGSLSQPAATSPSPLSSHSPVLALLILSVLIALALTPLSQPLWNHLPELRFLQFPWRLLALQAAALALAAGLALGRLLPTLRGTPAVLAALTLAAVSTTIAIHSFRQPCDAEDTPAARLALFQSHQGTDPTDEYTPVTADNDALNHHDPAFWLAPDPTAPPPNASPSPLTAPSSLAPHHFTVTAARPEDLILNLRDFPAWQVALTSPATSQAQLPEHLPRDDGLIAIAVPAGASSIDIAYTTRPEEIAGDALSVAGLLTLAALAAHSRRRRSVIIES